MFWLRNKKMIKVLITPGYWFCFQDYRQQKPNQFPFLQSTILLFFVFWLTYYHTSYLNQSQILVLVTKEISEDADKTAHCAVLQEPSLFPGSLHEVLK